MDVAVVTVGDELLAGDIENTNATWLCRQLTNQGVDVRRVLVLPDDRATIAQEVNEARADYDAVIVTGGLGPTHDDVTMAAVADAVGRDLIEHSEAAASLDDRGYGPDTRTPKTAYLPAGARALHNEVGVAPGAVLASIYVFPGVPAEMKAMFDTVAEEFTGEPRYQELVETSEPERHLVDRLTQLRERFPVTVGSYPGETVRVKITGTDKTAVTDAAAWFRERVESPST